jgi:hypothetical protein
LLAFFPKPYVFKTNITFFPVSSKYLNISNLVRIDENKFENIDGEDGMFDTIPSPSPRSKEPISPVTPSVSSIDVSNDAAYADFVQDTNEIGLDGTEPAIEEI